MSLDPPKVMLEDSFLAALADPETPMVPYDAVTSTVLSMYPSPPLPV